MVHRVYTDVCYHIIIVVVVVIILSGIMSNIDL